MAQFNSHREPSDLKRCFITGATGVIGPSLVAYLLKNGWQVRILVHQQFPQLTLPGEVQIYRGDLTESDVLRSALHGVDTVFHLAAKLHINNPTPDLRAEYERVNVTGTQQLVHIAQDCRVQQFVFFSTIRVYGPSHSHEIFDENSPVNPDSWYAETKLKGEQIALTGVPAIVLRLAAVYGPNMKGNYLRLVQALQRGRFMFVGTGNNRRTLIYETDVVLAALAAVSNASALGRIYNVTDGAIHTLKAIIEAICHAAGGRVPYLHLPTAFVREASGIIDDVCRSVGRSSPINRALVDKLVEDIAVSGYRLRSELSYRPQFDLVQGWTESLRLLNHRQKETP